MLEERNIDVQQIGSETDIWYIDWICASGTTNGDQEGSNMKLLLILMSAAIVVRADITPPSLTWNGDPMIVSSSGGGLFGLPVARATDTGMVTGADCFVYAGECDSSFTVIRNFIVTSPGTFILSTSIGVNSFGANCNPGQCFPSAMISARFFGSTATLGLSQLFTDSGSSTIQCTDPQGCEAFVNLNDAQSNVVDLGLGSHFLQENYVVTTNGNGDPTTDAEFEGSLVPAPEPRGYIVVLAVTFVLFIVFRKQLSRNLT